MEGFRNDRTLDFDNVYAFKPIVKRTASVPNQSSYFENEKNHFET